MKVPTMLQVSEAAAAALEEARTAQDLPDTSGVRVFAEMSSSGEAEISLAFTDEPMEGDTVTEQSGTSLFIAPEVAGPLAEAEIDVLPTPEGPSLVIKPQNTPE